MARQNDIKSLIDTLYKELPKILQESGQKILLEFGGFLGAELDNYKPSSGYASGGSAFPAAEETWSNSEKLRFKKGNLWRSFIDPKSQTSNTTVKVGKDGVEAHIESDLVYAEVHERGMFIKSKGKMQNYFWAQYINTKNEFFKIMALSVLSKGGVNIPARPYFEPAFKEFESKGVKKFLETLLDRIVRVFN